MPRRSRSKAARSNSNQEQNEANENVNEAGRSVASHVRDRQRAVAEREASRLARPEKRKRVKLAHADRKKSAVTSTPFGLHRGSSTVDDDEEVQEWCGPFSVARQVLRQREEAKRKAEEEENNAVLHPLDDLMNQVGQEQKKKAHPSLTWKGEIKGTTPSSLYAKRQKRMEARQTKTIPTLFTLCVDFLVDNFQHVESLGHVDNDCRVAIAKELVKRNQLNAKEFESLVSEDMECLEIIDCAGIPQDTMAKVLTGLHSLSFLMLTHAGRCFGPKSVDVLLETKPPLCCLSIAGAYLLGDEHAASLIQASAPTLSSVCFDTCPMLGEKFLRAIATTDGSLLEVSLKHMSLSSDSLKILASTEDAMRNVKSLTFESMPGITDAVLGELLQVVVDSLETLDVSNNYDLTDASLSAIRQFNTGLRSLTMTGVKELTSLGLETFFTYDLEGLPPPPKLKVLKLGSCSYEAVSDQVLKLCTANSSTQNKESMGARGGGLAQLDIEGSTLVTDSILEHLVEGASAKTLTEINLSYCPHITDQGLGYFVSKCGSQLSKIQVWGCAQLSDEFFDGHDRVNDKNFEVVGAWMKRSGTRSLR